MLQFHPILQLEDGSDFLRFFHKPCFFAKNHKFFPQFILAKNDVSPLWWWSIVSLKGVALKFVIFEVGTSADNRMTLRPRFSKKCDE